ncbi:MAG: branched-chain amino acid transport system ATP-binding protein livF [Alphaproteobacteria bacterium]|nr:branched-chain amino acid transport system ATP-binding protein livF [Alphaproteobacteria bacterium]
MTRERALLTIAAIIAAASPYFGIPGWTPALATVAALTAVSLIGLNLIFGYCGMLALGQAAFSALSAYGAGILFTFGVPSLAAAIAGFALAVCAARLVAEIFIRLPGIYLAVGTLGFSYVVEGLARAFPSITGGASGLVLTPPFAFGENGWYVAAVVTLAIATASMAVLVRGRTARMLKMVHRDELAAAVAGIDVIKLKLRIFTIGAAYSAAGGLILAHYTSVVSPEMGGANTSLEYLAMVIIGGTGSIAGPVLGAVLTNWLFSVAGAAAEYELLVYGFCFLVVILFAPAGVAGIIRQQWVKITGQKPAADIVLIAGAGPRPEAAPGDERGGLRADNISKRFGGLQAVHQVTFDAKPGEIVALLGPNGAGKSTLFNILSGIERPDSGEVFLAGKPVSHLGIHQRAMQIGRSFQLPRLVADMSVLQNVVVRADQLFPTLPEAERQALAKRQLDVFDLAHLATENVSEVAVGLHKLIDIARAALGSPRLVLLDEPAVGLSSDELGRLRNIIHTLKAGRSAIVVVDHNLEFILSIADRILVMESGAQIALGTAADVIADPRVRAAYMGVLT